MNKLVPPIRPEPPLPKARNTATAFSPDQARNLLRGRRTVHNFLPQQVPQEIIDAALESAVWAPNHGLTEPWRFYKPGPETIEAIAKLNSQLVTADKGAAKGLAKYERWRNIPGWLVVTRVKSDDPVQAREDEAACACAIHNFALHLWTQGIGVKWVTSNIIRHPVFCDQLWVDNTLEEPVAIVWYGYPQEVPDSIRRTPAERFIVDLP